MRRRPLIVTLTVMVAAAVIWLGSSIALGHSILLGLDLEGGASLVLKPVHQVSTATLNQAITIIDRRVDGLGVSSPNVARQGDNVVIELPGIKDPEKALKVIGETAELRFRAVYCTIAPADPKLAVSSKALTTAAAQALCTSASTTAKQAAVPTTADVTPDAVVLPQENAKNQVTARYILGPTLLTGKVISGANAEVDPTSGLWEVAFTLTNSGSNQFDDMAAANYQKEVAFELDGVVQSAPEINSKQFNGSGVINGSSSDPFTQAQASDLALVLRYGSLPVQFEPQQLQTVSATIGKDSLRAGLIAGLVGILLVLAYMIFYYRVLGAVVFAGLVISGAFLYSILAQLSSSEGLALTLSGVTGIIVSVGVTVDSYVVYFERLKDEIRSGSSVRTSVDKGWARAYRTILTADFVSFAAAAILYWLTVGDVRGFAFTLGLSTLLDVVTALLFTRPLVILLGRSKRMANARNLGVGRGLGVGYVAGDLA
jgi:preprotein translocase subunit SecD